MPFSLHPSGFCCWYDESNVDNLQPGKQCPVCKRVAGHAHTCKHFKYDKDKSSSSRSSLFNATGVLWAGHQQKNLFTFTLPSLEAFTYQRGYDCPETGDLAITEKFSKVVEAWAMREKRRGHKLSYAWVAEAQIKRQKKYGGIGDLHFHLAANVRYKKDRKVVDLESLQWLQNLWCSHVGAHAGNCMQVDDIIDGIYSIPGYLSKYMAKGTQRMILSRKFGATRDLTRFKPITMQHLPEVELINEQTRTVTRSVPVTAGPDLAISCEVVTRYYDTNQVLELYGADMAAVKHERKDPTDPRFTDDAINQRKIRRVIARYRGLVQPVPVH